jgi:TolB protein
LTQTPLDERAPAISPDRAWIAYSSSDGAISLLRTADRSTTRLPLDAAMRHSNPSWSPDGKQLVFTSYTTTPQGEDASLWLYDVEQRAPRQLLLQDGAQDYGNFHPDGGSIVYSSSGAITVFGFGYSVVQQLWKLNVLTGRVEQLMLAPGKDTQPVLSPDGTALLFLSDRERGTQEWRATGDGRQFARLTDGAAAAEHPAWSPDGREVVFVSSTDRGTALAVVAGEGGPARPFEMDGRSFGDVRDPHWR